MFYLLLLRISYPNHSVVVSVIPVFVLLHPHIFHTNRHEVVNAILALVLLCLRIGHTNRHEVVSAIPAFVLLRLRIGHTNRPVVVGTTPLICAWAVMKCLLPRILYIIRCIAVWKEMAFVGRIYQTPKLTNSQRISLPSPLGEGLGVRLFPSYSGIITTSTLFPCAINWCATNCCRRWGVMFCSSAR